MVISISYGSSEYHIEEQAIFNTEAMKLGLGFTLLATSGDNGAPRGVYNLYGEIGQCSYRPPSCSITICHSGAALQGLEDVNREVAAIDTAVHRQKALCHHWGLLLDQPLSLPVSRRSVQGLL
jgi:hypothetical protein